MDEPRRILITGARRGIGAACAVGLARPGLAMVLHHLGAQDEVSHVAAACRGRGAQVEIAETDLADLDAVVELARTAAPVDVLVNNASRPSNSELFDLSDSDWTETFAVNVSAPMVLARELSPGMRERSWGRIVNITSATVRIGGPSGPAYVASKAALVGLTRSLARGLGRWNITVNALSPGAIRTESEDELLPTGVSQEEVDADVLRHQALHRRLVADDMVGPLRFLVSEDSFAVTGQVIEAGAGLVYR